MKKILIGAFALVLLTATGTAYAATTLKGIGVVESRSVGILTITKFHDDDTGVACYAVTTSTANVAPSVSCVDAPAATK